MIANYPDKIFLLALVKNNTFVETHFEYELACRWLSRHYIYVLHKEIGSKIYKNIYTQPPNLRFSFFILMTQFLPVPVVGC